MYRSTRSEVGALRRPAHTLGARAPPRASRSGVATSRGTPLDVERRRVLERPLHTRLGAQRQAEQFDEAARRRMVEGVADPIVGREVIAVQGSLGAPADDLGSAVLEAHPDHTGHVHLVFLDEGVERRTQRREPEAVVRRVRAHSSATMRWKRATSRVIVRLSSA